MRRHYSTEQYAVYKQEAAEEFWGQVRCRTQHALQQMLEADSEQQMADYLGLAHYERRAAPEGRIDSRNGFYERDYVTPLGSIRIKVRRTRKRSFLPRGICTLERRAPEVAEMIRQAFLRGISTRAVGRVVALLTDEPVSAQTVSRLTRVLDQEVEKFHRAPLVDEWAYLLLDGVWLKVRRAFGPQRVLLLVAYGVRADGSRQLLAIHPGASGKPSGLGSVLVGPARARLSRSPASDGDQRRLPRPSRGDRNHLSTGASSALLGAQDAQSARWRAAPRSGRCEARCPAHLPGPQRCRGSPRLRPVPLPLAGALSGPGAPAGARTA